MMRLMSSALAPAKIRVNCICPTIVQLTKDQKPDINLEQEDAQVSEEAIVE